VADQRLVRRRAVPQLPGVQQHPGLPGRQEPAGRPQPRVRGLRPAGRGRRWQLVVGSALHAQHAGPRPDPHVRRQPADGQRAQRHGAQLRRRHSGQDQLAAGAGRPDPHRAAGDQDRREAGPGQQDHGRVAQPERLQRAGQRLPRRAGRRHLQELPAAGRLQLLAGRGFCGRRPRCFWRQQVVV